MFFYKLPRVSLKNIMQGHITFHNERLVLYVWVLRMLNATKYCWRQIISTHPEGIFMGERKSTEALSFSAPSLVEVVKVAT